MIQMQFIPQSIKFRKLYDYAAIWNVN